MNLKETLNLVTVGETVLYEHYNKYQTSINLMMEREYMYQVTEYVSNTITLVGFTNDMDDDIMDGLEEGTHTVTEL